MLGGDIHDIVHAVARDCDVGQNQRLSIHIPIDSGGEEQTEAVGIDVGQCQDGLVRVSAGAGIVIMVGQDTDGGCGGDVCRCCK